MFYHRRLSKYKYKRSSFKDVIEFAESQQGSWLKGKDQNGVEWNVEELPLKSTEFPVLMEIYDALNLDFKRPSFFLSRIPKVGLGNHVDHRKWGNLAFPLTGDFENSKINFHDPFNQIVETINFEGFKDDQIEPFVINTRMTHSVTYNKPPEKERITLMLDIFEWPGHVFEKVDNGTLFNKDLTLFS